MGWVVERDLELDLDVEASDADFFDDETQKLLAAFEVEFVDGLGDGRGERLDPAAELVVSGERGPLFGEGQSLLGELGAAPVEFARPAFHLR